MLVSPNSSIHESLGQMGYFSVFQQRAGQGNKRKEMFYLMAKWCEVVLD